jgi:ABC-type Mn2+/Zn2+ transport system permease subunit
MTTMILISSVAMLVGIVGSFLIWRFDALRADEIEHTVVPTDAAALSKRAGEPPKAIGLG